jgi:hypothetical protein
VTAGDATLSDTAVLAGGSAPTGSITFRLFGPNDPTCSASPIFVSPPVPVAGAGTYGSAPFAPTIAGTYRWTATYGGDAHNTPVSTACDDPGESVVVTAQVLPAIRLDAAAVATSLPEPGGTFTGSVSITNTGTEPVTLIALADEDLNGVGTCSVPQVLAPGASYACTFPIVFTGNAGETKTIPVTATVTDANGHQVSATTTFVLSLTNRVPTLTVAKTAEPSTMVAPGGVFTYRVKVTNTSDESVTITGLADDVYGDLDGAGNCRLGSALAATGGTYDCAFTGTFTGIAGERLSDTVTATVVDDDASTASAAGSATVALVAATPQPPVPTVPVPTGPTVATGPSIIPTAPVQAQVQVLVPAPVAGPLARTGADVRRQMAMAVLAVWAGMLLLAGAGRGRVRRTQWTRRDR